MDKKLSSITEQFTESVIREMTRICDEVQGINLSQGFPDFACDQRMKKAAARALEQDYNQYPVTFGEPELRAAIAGKTTRFNRFACTEDEITVTCGATEAMMATMKAIINPGDEVIIFEPFYENYIPDCILSGAAVKCATLEFPDWTFDRQALKKLFSEKTKAIIINTPNNPTGKVFTREELEYIARLCQEWDVIAVTDEIYEHIVYDGNEHLSIASLPGMQERTVTINSISKTYSVTGWRVGWAIAAANITERIRKVHDFLTVGAPTPFQHAAASALQFETDYYAALQQYYAKARFKLYDSLNQAGFTCSLPQGAYYIMADIQALKKQLAVSNDVALSTELIRLTGIATVPGSAFYVNPGPGQSMVRFTFCKKMTTLDEVDRRLLQLKSGCLN